MCSAREKVCSAREVYEHRFDSAVGNHSHADIERCHMATSMTLCLNNCSTIQVCK